MKDKVLGRRIFSAAVTAQCIWAYIPIKSNSKGIITSTEYIGKHSDKQFTNHFLQERTTVIQRNFTLDLLWKNFIR